MAYEQEQSVWGESQPTRRLGASRSPNMKRLKEKRTSFRSDRTIIHVLMIISSLIGYVPPMQPYELSELVSDLVRWARYLLRPGGRLVFFLPTVTDEYTEVDVYSLLCEGMEVIANSVQNFGSWGRRVGSSTIDLALDASWRCTTHSFRW